MKIGGVLQEPIIIEVLYASKHTVVALVEGVVYVKNDGDFMHPVSIPVGDGEEWMSFDSVARMECQEYEDAYGIIRNHTPQFLFDRAIRESLLHDYDSHEEEREEANAILGVLHDVFETELENAQAEAFIYLQQCDDRIFHEEIHRLLSGEWTREEFKDWISDHTQVMEEEEVEYMINSVLGGDEEENG